ncbi:hypothetical protein [Aquibacillus rhizosphaerae]|uniref:HeH/LEM domain-containing protein n=1 Tax=Aquibacillus rhizosphaerae TaxID=3051431 RepID=A0ABT7LAD2_9BACI|nr:hypothetical protein [Aquibacillus sp. LR5S19]MDL4842831.1 hypothetical protein [Aquibacillus sp. LR5S19]
MGLFAFNRMRREQAQKEKEQQEPKIVLEHLTVEEIKEYTNDEIRARLDELEIEYKSTDDKQELAELLSAPLA